MALIALLFAFMQMLSVVFRVGLIVPRTWDALIRKIGTRGRGWSDAERIDSGGYATSRSVQVACDGNGNAFAIGNESTRTWARRYTPSHGWSEAETIDDSRKSDVATDRPKENPKISIDRFGNVLAVWRAGIRDEVVWEKAETWTNRYTAGTGWGEAARFDHAPGDFMPAEIVGDTYGNARAVWVHHDNDNGAIWTKHYTVANGWGEATSIARDAGKFRILQVFSDGHDNTLVLWGREQNERDNTFACCHSKEAGWGDATLIANELFSYHGGNLSVDFDAAGNVLVVWSNNEGDSWQVYICAKRYRVGTGWEETVKIDPGIADRNGGRVSESSQPKVAFDADGNALAIWTQERGRTHSQIWTNRFTVATGWATAAPIATKYLEQTKPVLAIDAGGNAIAVWLQRDGVGASRYTAAAGWSLPERIYTDMSEHYARPAPQIALDASGNAIVVGQHDGRLCNTIWSNQYIVGKGWERPASISNDYTRSANTPWIACGPHGEVHVLWEQRDIDSSNVHFWTSHWKRAND